jgi:tetratricopeptide (TPR) repeat protein
MKPWLPCALGGLLAAAAVSADVIVLKSGRRINAGSVTDEGDRYRYETASGELSVRKELVDRIERGGVASIGVGVSLPVAPPQVKAEGYEEVARQVVRDGQIDRNFLARLETDAQNGGSAMAGRIAMAHHAAAQFELQKSNLEAALNHYRRALTYAPEHTGVLLSLAYLHLKQSEFTQAQEFLERARRTEPNSFDVAKLSGWAYYGANKIELAVQEWRRAIKIRPDAEVELALRRAELDKQVESEFKEGETRHFTLRYHGGAAPQLAREILRTLEGHFTAIETELSYAPPDAIGVILYTEQAFMDVTRLPSWVSAVNDGRIRIPVQGLTSVSSDLNRTLKHELAHSFIHQKTRGRAPVWLQEGVAQWMEGQRSRNHATLLVEAYERGAYLPLRMMEGSFVSMPTDVAGYAYAWSLGIVEFIVQNGGMSDIARVLDRINTEPSTEAALRSVLRMDYPEVEAETVKYLKRNR